MWRVAWYRFRVTFARRWGGLFAIVLLIGLIGGLALGAVGGARRTQSSFPAYLARTNASDLVVGNTIFDPVLHGRGGYDSRIVARTARLPFVKQVESYTGVFPNTVPLITIHSHFKPGEQPPIIGGSVDGEYSTLDRLTVSKGRLADPSRVDEAVMSAGTARELGMHVGSVLPLGFFTNAQVQLPTCCSANGEPKPHLTVDLKLVGIVVFNVEVVQDDIDALGSNYLLFTPALMRQLAQCCSFYTNSAIKVDGGSRNVTTVEGELTRVSPKLNSTVVGGQLVTSVEEAKAERAIEPESIALGVFGAIAAVATLLIAGQLIGRQLRLGSDERMVMRALGAGPATTVGDGLIGAMGAVMLGSVVAVLVAVGLSPLAPLGPVRRVERAPGIALDWTVLGFGLVGLLVVLSAVAIAIAYRQAPHRVARRATESASRASRVARAAANAGLPAPTVTGVRFALEPAAGGNSVPVRSAIVGAVLAIMVVTSTLTFGASLKTLVSHPALYGWNWDYEMLAGFAGNEDLPQPQITTLLNHDRYVAAWSGIYFSYATIGGKTVPVIGASPNTSVAPPLLSGHGFNAPDQIVFGAQTLAELHKHVGETVEVRTGLPKPTELRIVGTATMPAIGTPDSSHTTMGTGALLDYQLIPANVRNLQGSTIPGPNAILVRIRTKADPAAARHSLQQINDAVNKGPDSAGGVVGVLRPAEIVNYRTMGTTPAMLGAILAVGAVFALALTLIASVRRRRRDLALLKTLGFTRRQLAAVVAWQSTIAIALGVAIGVPLGIVTGRALWDLFAHAIHAVPKPTVPALTIALISAGALALANLVAAIPARQAARTQTSVLLHAE